MPAARTPAQAEAARRNGALSRGPVTTAGKARSSLNALRHGLASEAHPVVRGEDPAAFAALHADLQARFAPDDAVSAFLVRRLASTMWRTLRAERLEAETVDTREQRPDREFMEGYNPHSPAVWDVARFNAVARYQGHLERTFLRTLKELELRCAAPCDADEPSEPDAAAACEPNEPGPDTQPVAASDFAKPMAPNQSERPNEPDTARAAEANEPPLTAAVREALALHAAIYGPRPNEPEPDRLLPGRTESATAPTACPTPALPPHTPPNRAERRRRAALERRIGLDALLRM